MVFFFCFHSFANLTEWHQGGWSDVPRISRSLHKLQFLKRPFLGAESRNSRYVKSEIRSTYGRSNTFTLTWTFLIWTCLVPWDPPSQIQKAPHSTLGWWHWVRWTIWCDISSWGLLAVQSPPPQPLFSHSFQRGTVPNRSRETGAYVLMTQVKWLKATMSAAVSMHINKTGVINRAQVFNHAVF